MLIREAEGVLSTELILPVQTESLIEGLSCCNLMNQTLISGNVGVCCLSAEHLWSPGGTVAIWCCAQHRLSLETRMGQSCLSWGKTILRLGD